MKWLFPLENANLGEGEWHGSHMSSPAFCPSIPGSSSGSPPGCCSPSEHTRGCICRWFGLALGRGSTEGPGNTSRIAAAPSPGVQGPPSSAVGGSGGDRPFLPPLPFAVCCQCLSPAWHISGSACFKELFITLQDKISPWLGASHALSLEGHGCLWLLPVSP